MIDEFLLAQQKDEVHFTVSDANKPVCENFSNKEPQSY